MSPDVRTPSTPSACETTEVDPPVTASPSRRRPDPGPDLDAEAEDEIDTKPDREPDRKKRKSADENPIPRCELCKQRKVRFRDSPVLDRHAIFIYFPLVPCV